MRLLADVIEVEGERVSPHSKFYIWQDKLFEPVFYSGRKCSTYKVITDIDRINKIINRKTNSEKIPTISSVRKVNKVINKDTARFELLDL